MGKGNNMFNNSAIKHSSINIAKAYFCKKITDAIYDSSA